MKRSKEQQKAIGQRIRDKRIELGLKQIELARKAYIDPSAMNKIEKGNKGIETDELQRIADVFGVDVRHLLGTLKEETQEITDVAAVMPLDSKAIKLLLAQKEACAVSDEAQYVSDLISFFIRALLDEACGDSGISLVTALADLSYWYEQERLLDRNTELREVLFHTQRKLRRNITANKEEVREASSKIFTEFCKSRSVRHLYIPTSESGEDIAAEMLEEEMYSAYADGDIETLDELNRIRIGKIFKSNKEGDEDGNI